MNKDKCLSPYVCTRFPIDNLLNLDRYIRNILSGGYINSIDDGHIIQQKVIQQKESWAITTCSDKRWGNLREAMKALDSILVSRGFVLLSQEEWDKLILLK